MKFIKRVKNLHKTTSKAIKKHREPLSIAFKDNVNFNTFARLRKGQIVISREMLRYHLLEALAKEPLADLDHIACTETGIKVGLLIQKFNTSVTAEIEMFIQKAMITFSEQRIVVKIHNEKVIGNNLLGNLVSVLVGTIISEVLKKAVFSIKIPIHYNKKHNIAIINLSRVPVIRRLRKPVLGSKSMLHFISIVGAEHTDAGINLKCKIKIF